MINKILNIKNVGKFRYCSMGRGNEYDFAPNTFIFGHNTKGKSTLTAILKSLSTGNPNYIIGRKTFGSIENQQVNIQILKSDNTATTHTYTPNTWNNLYSDVEIFDSHFIAQNVYVNESITEDNEKAIESIVLGEQGKDLEKKFKTSEENCQNNTNRKSEITREFTRHLGYYQVQFEDFRKITVDKNITDKILQKESEIKAYGAHQQVKVKLEELITTIKTWTVSDFEVKLSPTISLQQKEIKDHILNHLKNNQESIAFFAQGVDLLKDKKNSSDERRCVFCGQELGVDAEKLISAYETLFSKSYRELSRNVRETSDFFNTWKIEADLRRFKGELSTLGIEIDFGDEIQKIATLVDTFKKELRLKSDLNYKIDFTSLSSIDQIINNTKTKVQKVVDSYSGDFDSVKLDKLKKEKVQLVLTDERHKKPWVSLCEEYDTLEKNTVGLADIREKALEAKNKYAESILANYEKEVNEILKFLQADFQLFDTKPKTGLRNITRLFNIRFYGSHTIDLSSEDEEISNFGNSLGESDKRLLAFAFFIAGLKVRGAIQNKVIIFDDPMSSLDAERKLRTIQLLKKLIDNEKPRQLIILTHECIFFSLLNKYIPSRKCFKIIYDPLNKTSSIDIMKPNEEYLDDYYKSLEELKALESAKDDEITWDSLRPIRDILEQLLKKKYYFHIKQEIESGGSISAFITKLKADGIYNDEKSKKIDDNLAHFWNHDDSDSTVKREDFSVGDLRGIIKTFFEVIEII